MRKTVVKYIAIGVSCVLLLVLVLGIIFYNQKFNVPDITGKHLTEAMQILKDSSFKSEYTPEYSDVVAKDIVISQGVEAGTQLKRGSVVSLKVSAGKEPVTVPSVVNIPNEQAEKSLLNLNFSVVKTEVFSDDYEKGMVTSQSVKAGEVIDKGSEIEIVISKGPDLVQVPNVTGKSQAEAMEIISNAGLEMKTDIQCSNTVQEGLIISQDIQSGEMVKRNSTVLVIVSAGVSNTVGNTPSNSRNWGFIATQGDWVYYANIRYNYYLYKMRTDGSEKQILTKGSVHSLNVVGEWIYYTDDSPNGSGLYKIRIDGSQKTKLSSNVYYWVYVVNDCIYYAESDLGSNIFKMKTDGTGIEKICSDNCSRPNVVGDWIYYTDRDTDVAYKIRTDGTKRTRLHSEFTCYDLVVDGSVAFGLENTDLQKINTDGSGFLIYRRYNQQISFINANDGWLYFLEHDLSESTFKYAFYKMRYDWSQKTKILDLNFQNTPNYFLHVSGDWLYFPNEDDHCYLYRIKTDGTNLQKMYE